MACYFLRFAVISLLLILLAACDRTNSSKTGASIKTSITFLHYFTDSMNGGLDDMAKIFNSQNSRYDLKPIPLDHESFKTSIRHNLEAGNPPDLYSYWAGARTASIIEYLEPIDDVWAQTRLDERFSPAVIKAACEYNGKKYFIPLTQHYIGFFYNKKVFAAHGLTPPKTWKEFLNVCAILKSKGITPIALGAREKWPAQFWFDLLLLRTAPYEFRQALMQGKIGYQDPRVSAVFEQWQQLIQKGYFNRNLNDLSWDSGANELVYTGKAAMTLMGTWVIGYFTNTSHKWVAGKDFDFFPFPIIDPTLPLVSMGPIDGLVVPRKATNKDGAKQVMAFLTAAAPQEALSKGSGALAPSRTVPVSFYGDIQRRVLQEIARSSHFAFNYDLSTPPEIAEIGLNAFTEFLEFPADRQTIQQKLATDAASQFRKLKANQK
ncbi:extracellular solute-binding protein [Trichlorobacter lovleyi]|uniref:ABC transporter substrate-binding protein n=1 Tax=Trichlorobacter lovleyi TaxID=313985 RepID=UPI00223F1AA5|nr:extracellular solute-binding protein [Trichlorobacter lovleyi]QOX77558.1 extracellular solute-binding protein [Trichlorobacter lovleyi]